MIFPASQPASQRVGGRTSYRIEEALKEGARYGDATVDITPLAKEYVGASRKNEALAELVSMNAVASRVKHQDSEVSEAELLRRSDHTLRHEWTAGFRTFK